MKQTKNKKIFHKGKFHKPKLGGKKGMRPLVPASREISSIPGFHQLMMELPAASLPLEITSRYRDNQPSSDSPTLPNINNKITPDMETGTMGTGTTLGLLRKRFQLPPS
jgi:hypothetical protein